MNMRVVVALAAVVAMVVVPASVTAVATRAEAVALFKTSEQTVAAAKMNWNGNVAACNAGTNSQGWRNAAIGRVNLYRKLCGLAPVSEDATYSNRAQKAALMMAGEGALSHSPSGFKCQTAVGATAAAQSNLGINFAKGGSVPSQESHGGPHAIDGWIDDTGNNNKAVGHRRAILFPRLQKFGIGSVPMNSGWTKDGWWTAASAGYWLNSNLWVNSYPSSVKYVAWPPANGFIPKELFPTSRRFSLSRRDGSFENAVVSMTVNGQAISHTIVKADKDTLGSTSMPDEAIVWQLDNNEIDPDDASQGDIKISVTVSKIKVNGGSAESFSYTTTIIDTDNDGGDGGGGGGGGGDFDIQASGVFRVKAKRLKSGKWRLQVLKTFTSPCDEDYDGVTLKVAKKGCGFFDDIQKDKKYLVFLKQTSGGKWRFSTNGDDCDLNVLYHKKSDALFQAVKDLPNCSA